MTLARRRLLDDRVSYTRKFKIRYKHKDGTDDVMRLYLTAGVYEDGRPGELFIRCDRLGTLARGALDSLATMISLMLQYDIPIGIIVEKLRHTRFEPAGFTGDTEFKMCTSVLDLIAQWLEKRFMARAEQNS